MEKDLISQKTLWVMRRADLISNPTKRKSIIETTSNRSSVSALSREHSTGSKMFTPNPKKKLTQKTKSITILPDLSIEKISKLKTKPKNIPKSMILDTKYNPNLPSIEQISQSKILMQKDLKKIEEDILSPSDLFESPLIKKRLVHSKKLENHGSTVLTCRFSPNEIFIGMGCEDGITRVQEISTNRLYKLKSKSEVPITSVRWHPLREALIYQTKANGIFEVWEAINNRLRSSVSEEGNFIFCSEHNVDGSFFATAGQDARIRVYDNENVSKIVHEFSRLANPTHANRIYSLKFHEDDKNLIVSGGWDETLILWDLRMSHSANFIYGPLICGDSLDILHNEILTGSWRDSKQLQIWDLRNLKEKHYIEWKNEFLKEKPFVYTCTFEKKYGNYIFVGSSGINEIRVYENGKKYECLDIETGFKKGIYSLDAAKNKNQICYGTDKAGIFSYY